MNSSRELKPLSETKPMTASSASSRKKSDVTTSIRQPYMNSKILKTDKSKVNSLEQKMSSSDSNFRAKEAQQGYKNIKKKVAGGLITKNKENVKKQLSTTMMKSTLVKEDSKPKAVKTIVTPRSNLRDPKKTVSNKKQEVNQTSHKKLQPAHKVEPKAPLSLNQFEMGKKLGKGRFGDVYVVREKKLGFVLAMKVVNKQELAESDMVNQLVFEIKIQTFLAHPNTLRMYGCFSDEKNIYLLLELAACGCLFRQLRTKGSFGEDLAAYYLRQIVVALKYLHSNSIMHRDIKPQNILNNFGVLKLCDFGWSVYSPLYQRQTFCGTLDYVPPEIVTGDFYDEKVDIWCLGILCYQLCTGRAPFEAKNSETETYDKILSLSLDFPVTMSVEVVDFISKLLCKNPKNRMSFQQIEAHPWMKRYENEAGRMISKEIWDSWLALKGGL